MDVNEKRKVGNIDKIEQNFIYGWAYNPNEPERRVNVKIFIDDLLIAEGLADQFREDLREAGIGDGCYAFKIRIPETFLVNYEGQNVEFKLFIENELITSTKLQVPKRKQLVGNFDGLEGLYVVGWVWDPGEPEKRLEVVALVDGVPVSQGVASLYREDLKIAGIGDGRYGFRIILPDNILDNREHQISVMVKDHNFELPKSPKKVRLQKRYKANIEGLKNFLLEGEVIDSAYPDRSIKIELWEGEKLIATGSTDPNRRGKFYLWLPKETMDGKVHTFQLRTNDGYILGYIVDIVNYISTPYEALQQYSKYPPSDFSKLQSFRMKAFAKQINLIQENQIFNPEEKINLIKEIEKALSIVSTGFKKNINKFYDLTFPCFTKPKVSIIVPVHNKFEVTYNCLASIILATYVPYEVIVVDDGSSDKTNEIENIIKNIKVTRNEKAQGFLKACNKGAMLAEGEYIVILNNDTEVLDGWLNELLWVFENYDRVGLVGAKLLYPDHVLQEAGGIVFGNGQACNYGRGGNPYDPKYNYTRQVDYCSGACVMLPKWLWDELGGFDEDYAPAYWEDTDLAFKVREKGYKVVYTPFAQIVHYEGISHGRDESSGLKQYQKVNQKKFIQKWRHVLSSRVDEQIRSFELVDLVKDRNIVGRVLAIDHEVPRPDREAGGYATFQEIKLFQSLGFKVTFIPHNMAYLYGYVEDLQRHGVEVVYAPYYLSVRDFLESRGKEFDIFYIVRWHVCAEYIDQIRAINPQAKVLFCNADLHFLRELREALATDNKELLLKAIDTRERELEVMRKVDLVLSYNEAEHAVILSHNLDSTKVAKWPWVVYPKREIKPFEERADIAFLGNYRHFPNVTAVKFFVESVMPLLLKKLPEVRFLFYGSHLPEELKELESEHVIPMGYIERLEEIFQSCRVFVAPLQSGAGIKGKVMEALSYGVPSVLSPIAVEGTGIRDGLEAFIVSKPEEYVEAIKKLYTDKNLWVRMSENAIRFVTKEYSFERGRELVRNALEMVGLYVPTTKDEFCLRDLS